MRVTRRRALGLAAGAAALGASRRLVIPVEAQAAERHGMSAFGDLALPADFPHFPYVNANAPKGGTYSEVISSRGYNGSFLTFNSLNGYILKGEGAFGLDYHVCRIDGALGQRAGRDVWSRRARGAHLRRWAHVYVPAAAGSEIPRRQRAHRARCRLVARHAEGQGPSDHHAVAARFSGRAGGRRSDRGGPFRAQPRARRAAVRRRPADFFQGLLFEARFRRVDVGHSARQRRLQDRQVRYRPLHRIRTGEGLVGRRSTGGQGPQQLRHHPLRILPRPRRRFRRLHRRQL